VYLRLHLFKRPLLKYPVRINQRNRHDRHSGLHRALKTPGLKFSYRIVIMKITSLRKDDKPPPFFCILSQFFYDSYRLSGIILFQALALHQIDKLLDQETVGLCVVDDY
jgi:hypothetical protein